MKLKYWMIFAACQLIGTLVPPHTNIHSNILPAFALLFLIPGIALVGFINNFRLAVMIAIPLNAVAWYVAMRLWQRK